MPKAHPTPPLPLNGLFPIAKPSGPTSMRVIDSINPLLLDSRLFDDPNKPREFAHKRKERNKRKKNATHMGLKIGQGGTLDPLADGVLVIGVNRGTKHLNRFLECSKEYESIGMLGVATTTYDSEGPILSMGNSDNVTREDIERVLDQFRGKIKQTPPIFSALKMDGKPLYEYARENKPLPRAIPVREVTVSIDLIDFRPAEVTPGDGGHTYHWPSERLGADEKAVFSRLTKIVHDAGGEGANAEPEVDIEAPDVPEISPVTGKRPACFTVRMTVSSGTYVRSIVHDIGLALGCGAHVVKLTRTRQGEFALHGEDEEIAAAQEQAAAAVAGEASGSGEDAAVKAEAEANNDEGAMDATAEVKVESSDAAMAEPPAPAEKTTTAIPWDVWERALAEHNATLEKEKAEREQARGSVSPEEFEANFSEAACYARRRTGELKEWEQTLLQHFVPVELPVVRDSKWRAQRNAQY